MTDTERLTAIRDELTEIAGLRSGHVAVALRDAAKLVDWVLRKWTHAHEPSTKTNSVAPQPREPRQDEDLFDYDRSKCGLCSPGAMCSRHWRTYAEADEQR